MKIRAKILLGVLLVAVCGLAIGLHVVRADDNVNAKLLAIFPQFDADHNAILSPEEQSQAIEFVRKKYGDTWAQEVQRLFKAAAASDGSVTRARWQEQAKAFGQIRKQTSRVAMRDGKHLATDIYLPPGEGPFPVVLARTPYGIAHRKDGAEGFTHAGFVYVEQDMRGRYASEGENLPFIGCGWNEHQDGVDTIAWLKKQLWCNGKIGTIGGSAGGITQNLLAGAAPEGLQAQYITVAAASLYSDATYIGGAFRKADIEGWLTGNKFDPQALLLMHAHQYSDNSWRTFDTSLKYSVMNVPAVHQGGWFDMFAQATINEYVGRQHEGGIGSRGTQKLIMGPWTHATDHMPAGEFQFPDSKTPAQYRAGRWFEHYLEGADNGVEKEPAVAYYVMGDTSAPGAPGNAWHFAADWPIPTTETAYFFARNGILTPANPTDTSAQVAFTFEPTNPCPTVGGNNLTLARGPFNQNKIENRSDVVMFTTAPLETPVEVTGRVKAKVFVASSAVDTDLSVRLCDVYPDGKSYLIAEGMLRLRFRKSCEKPEPLTPGQIEEVTVDCWSTSIVFNQGHRIRATVTSSNYPRFDKNPGTGQPWSDTGEQVRQTNHIYCDTAHPSCLLLPVIAPKVASAAR